MSEVLHRIQAYLDSPQLSENLVPLFCEDVRSTPASRSEKGAPAHATMASDNRYVTVTPIRRRSLPDCGVAMIAYSLTARPYRGVSVLVKHKPQVRNPRTRSWLWTFAQKNTQCHPLQLDFRPKPQFRARSSTTCYRPVLHLSTDAVVIARSPTCSSSTLDSC